jgi:AcrR family transcriptional regulator
MVHNWPRSNGAEPGGNGDQVVASRRTTPAVRRGDLRERQILDAAEKLLGTRGYADMTVGDIAEAAGITRGALYFYFASKQDVLTALVARTVQALQEKSGAALIDTASVAEVISTALERTAQLWREHGLAAFSQVADLLDRTVEDGPIPTWTTNKRRRQLAETAKYPTLTSAPGRDRTCDQPLRRRLLYPLSYGGSGPTLANGPRPMDGSFPTLEPMAMHPTREKGDLAVAKVHADLVGRVSRFSSRWRSSRHSISWPTPVPSSIAFR